MRVPAKFSSFLVILILGALIGTLGSLTATSSPLSSWHSVAMGSPIWLQQSGGTPGTVAVSPPRNFGGPQRSVINTSIMPHTDAVCSADHDAPLPNDCSVFSTSGPVFCSAHRNSGQACSAFSGPPGTSGTVQCSVHDTNNRACSTIPPNSTVGSPAFCSADSNISVSDVRCSVLGNGLDQRCSAKNNSPSPGVCSSSTLPTTRAICSVVQDNPTVDDFCSVKGPGSMTCSTYGANGLCSIVLGNMGRCTSFTGAGVAACSIQGAATAFCSVIGGTAGNPCIQP